MSAPTVDRPTNGHDVDVEELYRQNRGRLIGVAAKVGRDRHAAEDAVQEAFAEYLSDPEKSRNPAGHVSTRAKYLALDDSIHRGRQMPVGEHIDRTPDADTIPSSSSECMGDPEVAGKVVEVLAMLPADERYALEGHCLEGRSPATLAAEAGISKDAMYVRITRALERLEAVGIDLATLDEPAAREAVRVAVALAGLTYKQREAIQKRYLHGRKVVDIAGELDVSPGTIHMRVGQGLARLRKCGVDVADLERPLPSGPEKPPPGVEQTKAPDLKLTGLMPAVVKAVEQLRADYGDTAPADLPGMTVLAKHYRWDNKKTSQARAAYTGTPQRTSKGTPKTKKTTKPTRRAPSVEELADALTKAAGTDRVGVDSAEKILRDVFGQCSRDRAIAAKDLHNDRHGHPRAERPAAPPTSPAPRPDLAPTVAEAWLSRADDQVAAMFVNSDESTTKHPAVFRSMSGAQREITGHLVAEGYRPTSPWTEQGPDESFRTFTNQP